MKKIIGAVVVLMVFVAVFVLIKQEKSPTNATAENIRRGSAMIACGDAIWLYENTQKLDQEVSEMLAGVETVEAREKILKNPTPAQKAMDNWHNLVLTAIRETVGDNTPEYDEVSFFIGQEMLAIYQATIDIKIGKLNEAEFLVALGERYCAP